MERETGLEPATSSLGIQAYIESKSLVRFCCEFLNLQHHAESAVFESVHPNEAQTRQAPQLDHSDTKNLCQAMIDQHASTSVKVVRGSMSLHIRVVSNLFWPQLRFFNEFGPVLSWLRRCIKFTEANQEPSHEMHTGESSRAFLESTHITSPNSSTKKRRPGHVAL